MRKQWTAEQFQKANQKALELVVHALTTDGAQHKQWYLERIGETLGLNLDKTQDEFSYEPGRAP